MDRTKRLDDLYDVLEYDTHLQTVGKQGIFKPGERICINQERGALFSQCNQETQESDKRYYKCPAALESKIRFAIQKVIDINLITQ